MDTEETYFNIIKAIYSKLTVNIILSEKLKAFPLRSRTDKDAHSCCFHLTCYWMEVLATATRQEKEIKGIHSLQMILYYT